MEGYAEGDTMKVELCRKDGAVKFFKNEKLIGQAICSAYKESDLHFAVCLYSEGDAI